MALVDKLRGVFFVAMVFATSYLGVMFMIGPVLPLALLRPRLFRTAIDVLLGSWCYGTAALLELVLGMKVVITGDEIRHNESNLIMMNHRTRLDWMYFWSVLVRQCGVKSEKIILKSALKHIPGAGWAMQVAGFIFINRKWDEDKVIITKMLDYYTSLKYKAQVLLFPEGTDLTERTMSRSHDFARKNNLPRYEYCLHPRTTGFTFLASQMRQSGQLEAVYDVTIAYVSTFPQTEPELLMGVFPREVHFHIKRHPVSSLPITESGLQDWCSQRWQEKETMLEQFYKNSKFVTETGTGVGRNVEGALRMALFYWSVFVTVMSVILYLSWLARWMCCIQIAIYLIVAYKYGGFELFQADFYKFCKPKNST